MSLLPSDQAVAEVLWEFYKGILQNLYIAENKTLKEVKDIMANTYDFQATYGGIQDLSLGLTDITLRKSQYERHFKEWRFRKHLKKEEWAAVEHRLLKRKRARKESVVYVDGILLPPKKLRKEISRNGCALGLGRATEGNRSWLTASRLISYQYPSTKSSHTMRCSNLYTPAVRAITVSIYQPPVFSI
jgi:Clr5 domain